MNPTESQVFLFIVEEELERYKSELSAKDYVLLIAARKKLHNLKKQNLQEAARRAFRVMRTHFKSPSVNKIDSNDYVTHMIPLLEGSDMINAKSSQEHYQQILSGLSDAGRGFFINDAIPKLAAQSNDIKIQWRALANDNPVVFKEIHKGLLERLQSFKEAEDIEVEYYEQPVYLSGGENNSDQIATKQFGYKLINNKGTK